MGEKWTPEQFWEFMKGYTGEFEAGQIRDMLNDSGLILAVAPETKQPDLERIAKSLASMLTEYVEGGIKSNQNWRNGLNEIVLARLRRLLDAPVPSTATTVEPLVAALKMARARIEYLGAACTNEKHFISNERDFLPQIDAALSAAPVSAWQEKVDRIRAIGRDLDEPSAPPRHERGGESQHNLPGHDETMADLSSLTIRAVSERPGADQCDCENPEPTSGVALVSEDCPIHGGRS